MTIIQAARLAIKKKAGNTQRARRLHDQERPPQDRHQRHEI
jgi:hypothetical protein